MLLRLRRIVRHGQQFAVHRKSTFACVHRERAKELPRVAPHKQVLHAERSKGERQFRHIAGDDFDVGFRQTPVRLHDRGHARQVLRDLAKLAKVATRGKSVA